jgi:hypothetical protein
MTRETGAAHLTTDLFNMRYGFTAGFHRLYLPFIISNVQMKFWAE